ncbi:hypothetical protein PROFUN_14630 [Planoprotostelium fungivorum]|uniref:Uncharacterized protein n=1 Tax=Planoprotostelium fungivorum TaxID=1890364 RepID=A0A2P6N948_9EUKA|nr:hypothetical protein PROFUN_14630 [Planoprotostelium fungivorum]
MAKEEKKEGNDGKKQVRVNPVDLEEAKYYRREAAKERESAAWHRRMAYTEYLSLHQEWRMTLQHVRLQSRLEVLKSHIKTEPNFVSPTSVEVDSGSSVPSSPVNTDGGERVKRMKLFSDDSDNGRYIPESPKLLSPRHVYASESESGPASPMSTIQSSPLSVPVSRTGSQSSVVYRQEVQVCPSCVSRLSLSYEKESLRTEENREMILSQFSNEQKGESITIPQSLIEKIFDVDQLPPPTELRYLRRGFTPGFSMQSSFRKRGNNHFRSPLFEIVQPDVQLLMGETPDPLASVVFPNPRVALRSSFKTSIQISWAQVKPLLVFEDGMYMGAPLPQLMCDRFTYPCVDEESWSTDTMVIRVLAPKELPVFLLFVVDFKLKGSETLYQERFFSNAMTSDASKKRTVYMHDEE